MRGPGRLPECSKGVCTFFNRQNIIYTFYIPFLQKRKAGRHAVSVAQATPGAAGMDPRANICCIFDMPSSEYDLFDITDDLPRGSSLCSMQGVMQRGTPQDWHKAV